MAAVIPDISLGDDWISVNVESNIPVGSPFIIQLKTNYMALLQESVTKPSINSKDGVLMSNVFESESTKVVTPNSIEVWCKAANQGETAILNVQKIGGV